MTDLDTLPAVSLVNLDAGWVLMEDDSIWPIVELYDDEGDPTEDVDEAVALVAGNELLGYATIMFADTLEELEACLPS